MDDKELEIIEPDEIKETALDKRAKKAAKTPNDKGNKDKRSHYTADFDGLIDLVEEEGRLRFLIEDGDTLDMINIKGVDYLPPPTGGLPPQLRFARIDKVMDYAQKHSESGETGETGVCRGCTQLYDNLLEYHQNISELPDKDLYHILVLWDIHTYLIEKFNFSPIIYFYSIAERGKSRTLKGMINVAFRGIRKGDVRDAQLLRDCTHLRATLGFDMMDFWDKITSAGSVDVILNRYERGMTVSRVNRPDKGAFQDTDYYDVFGPTILATNEIIHDIADTRSIPIVMRKSSRDFEEEVTPEMALPLKEQLTAFRLAHYNDELPKIAKIAKSRLGDIVRPFHQIIRKVKPENEKLFKEIIKKIEKIRLTEKSSTTNAEIIIAWREASKEMVSGVVSNHVVASIFNEDKTEREKVGAKKVSNILKSFGLQYTKDNNNSVGFIWNEEMTTKLEIEYGVHPLPESVSTVSPVSPKEDSKDVDDGELPF